MSSPGPLYIVGTGPMIGSHVPQLFASQASFSKIVLFARAEKTLSEAKAFITAKETTPTIHTYVADVTDTAALTKAIEQAIKEVGPPEAVVYNPARINYVKFGEYSEDDIVVDFKIANIGFYTTARLLLPHLQALAATKPDAHPCLFVTSGAIIEHPILAVFSLSMAKAAQANLVKVLAQENKDKVHIALVTVGGPVSAQEKETNPENIAEKFLELWEQKKGAWQFEIKCGW